MGREMGGRFKREGIYVYLWLIRTSLVAQTVKRLSTMRETWVRALGWEDHLEKEMAIHSRTIAWKSPWTGAYSPWGRKESDTTEQLHYSLLWLIHVET